MLFRPYSELREEAEVLEAARTAELDLQYRDALIARTSEVLARMAKNQSFEDWVEFPRFPGAKPGEGMGRAMKAFASIQGDLASAGYTIRPQEEKGFFVKRK